MDFTERQILFEHWANNQSLLAIVRAAEAVPDALAVLAHSVAISQMWASRAEGVPWAPVPWPLLNVQQIESELVLLRDRWLRLLSCTAPDAMIHYVNSKGEACGNRFDDLMFEVFLHGAHHRGQVALVLRMRGYEPPGTTDYIPALRSQVV